jgi:hypothetical protein
MHLTNKTNIGKVKTNERWKKTFQENRPPEQTGVAILISANVDFKSKLIRRDKEGHFISIKRTIKRK